MALSLSKLKSYPHKSRKRIGRGNASGHGTYATRGQKGQRARTGGRKNLRRRGLKQFLLQIPKRKGFQGLGRRPAIVNIQAIEKSFENGALVNIQKLHDKGLINKYEKRVKVLGHGKLVKKLTIQAHYFSKSAKDAITKVGGKADVISK